MTVTTLYYKTNTKQYPRIARRSTRHKFLLIGYSIVCELKVLPRLQFRLAEFLAHVIHRIGVRVRVEFYLLSLLSERSVVNTFDGEIELVKVRWLGYIMVSITFELENP